MNSESTGNPEITTNEASPRVEPVAVIDIGTTAVRMAIAEIDATGDVRTLEELSQPIGLGKDAFTTGTIARSTIEECARILTSYRRVLDEYQIVSPDQIHVVATSAVREAQNQLSFVDRIYSVTGFQVELIDEAEVNRITYLGIQPLLKAESALSAQTIVVEVGGGSTELLVVAGEDVNYSHSLRLGSIRLRETLEAYHTPTGRARTIMESHIQRTLQQVQTGIPTDENSQMVALGGDIRFAADQLVPDWDHDGFCRIPLASLERFTNEIVELSTDKLVHQFHLDFTHAETLGPALLAYVELAHLFGLQQVIVASINLRDGLLKEMAVDGTWTDEFRQQIEQSALDLGRKFSFDEKHGRRVAELCRVLFQALQEEHHLDARGETLLYVAALLHDIGHIVGTGNHHKHGMYLIANSKLFGLSKEKMRLVSLIARYHRRALPRPTHSGYASLDRQDRIAVSQMAAILRIADALDRSYSQRIGNIECTRQNGTFVISIPDVDDLSLEQLALQQKSGLFEEAYGMKVVLRSRNGSAAK